MAEQLTFDLPGRPALGRDDFFVSPANATAVATVENWADWPGGKLVIVGPVGSGKTHLVHVWAASAAAQVIAAEELADLDIPALLERGTQLAVEDIDKIAGNAEAEAALFHLHNLALAEGGRLLLTRVMAAPAFTLADLQSRVAGCPLVRLEAPDDALLSVVLMKLFADRQLNVPARVISYLADRMERSFDVAGQVVAAIDERSLAQKRPITRALAGEVLDKLRSGGA